MTTLQPRLRWYQFRLQSLFVVMFLACVGMSWVGVKMQQARRQNEAVEAIKKLGGEVQYDYQVDASGEEIDGAEPPVPAWMRSLLGEDFLATVVGVSLNHTDVTDAGVEHLAELAHLTSLDLSDTQLTDAGLKNLKRLTQLHWLELSGTQVTDAGIEHVNGLTQLEELRLDGTQVTDAGLAAH